MRNWFPVAILSIACHQAPEASTPYNLLIVSLCSFRADHVGAYGYRRDTTPHMDAFARSATIFENGYTNATFTDAAHGSLFTGLYPGHSGLLDFGDQIRKDRPTLPEILGLYHYRSRALIASASRFSMEEIRTMSRGFGEPGYANDLGSTLAAWVDADTRPWLAWVHIRSAHAPYGSGEPFVSKVDPQVQQWIDALNTSNTQRAAPGLQTPVNTTWVPGGGGLRRAANDALAASMEAHPEVAENFYAVYDSGLRTADAELGQVMDRLGERLANTVVVVVGDHGEALGERHNFSHQGVLSDAVLHVPFLVRVPGGDAARISTPVSLVDLLPTLSDLAGAQIPAGLDGQSLVPLLRGEAMAARPILAQAVRQRGDDGQMELRQAVIAPPWLFLSKPGAEQLWRKEGEIWTEVPEEGKKQELREVMARLSAGSNWRAVRAELTPEQVQEMHKNGYW